MEIKYRMFSPCGNDTALVIGTDYDFDTKKRINDIIMQKHDNIEQVGFVNTEEFELQMAGGEFCGNATRSAIYNYLKGKEGSILIRVSGIDEYVEGGVDSKKNAWVQIPIYNSNECVRKLDTGIFEIKLKGIIIILIEEKISKEYLKNKTNIKTDAMEIIKKYNIYDSEAIGVVFLENYDEYIKINPVIWVKSIDTLFYETACGTASIAVALKEAVLSNTSQKIKIMQPSGQIILTDVIIKDKHPIKAVIGGKVKNKNIVEKIWLD